MATHNLAELKKAGFRKYELDAERACMRYGDCKEIFISPLDPGSGMSSEDNRGWTWEVATEDDFTPGVYHAYEYTTDPYGHGLFVWNSQEGWKQLQGTCQYSLPGDRAAAWRKLRRDLDAKKRVKF